MVSTHLSIVSNGHEAKAHFDISREAGFVQLGSVGAVRHNVLLNSISSGNRGSRSSCSAGTEMYYDIMLINVVSTRIGTKDIPRPLTTTLSSGDSDLKVETGYF